MCPTMAKTSNKEKFDDNDQEGQHHTGVKQLVERGIHNLPNKYIFPVEERPNMVATEEAGATMQNLNLPVIDFAELQGSNRPQVLKSLAYACEQYGFFQLINHGIPNEVISNMIDVSTRFFELPFEERSKYMSSNMSAPVRYGTSFNQNLDNSFCWRDFLKLMCHPLPDMLPYWPSSPIDLRKLMATYARETKSLFIMLMEAILESLMATTMTKESSTCNGDDEEDPEKIMNKFKDGGELMVVNCYPPCPEPELTLGMPPHSDYGFLTLLLQGGVEGLQVLHKEKWFTVKPVANTFVVNVGDHLEIFSNGRYKSVLHRVTVNSMKSRITVATLHSLPFVNVVRPWSELVNESNPRKYKDTDFASFLQYISSRDTKKKEFLETRKLKTSY